MRSLLRAPPVAILPPIPLDTPAPRVIAFLRWRGCAYAHTTAPPMRPPRLHDTYHHGILRRPR
jgi:hypothetical protein